MPIHTATTSTLSPPVTRIDSVSDTASTVPTAGLIFASTSSAVACTRIWVWTAHPVRATSRTTNSVRSPGKGCGATRRPPGVRSLS